MSFLTDVEAQAKQESERVIKELTQLKFDAQQVIHVLNALKLEVPKELRELSPIEVVVAPGWKSLDAKVDIPDRETVVEETRKARGRKGLEAGIKTRQAKAAKREEEIKKAITDQLSKGPVLRDKLMDALPYPKGTVNKIGTRMKKEGLLDYRTVGYQGSTEWFLPSRPITLETLRDEVVKGEGLIPLADMQREFGFPSQSALRVMLDELEFLKVQGASYYYEKPKGPVIKAIPASRRGKSFGGGVNGVSGDKISSNKEVCKLVAKARNQGATVFATGKHIGVSFAGRTVTLGKTPSVSGLKQDRERLKKMGLRV